MWENENIGELSIGRYAYVYFLRFCWWLKVVHSHVHAILTQCTALIICSITIATKDDDDSEMTRALFPIFLPDLRKSYLTICGESMPCLHDLVFPGLTGLELNFPPTFRFETSLWEDDLHPFISRISELQNLRVSEGMPEAIIQNVLANVPSLTSFIYLEADMLSDRTLTMMANGSLVPRLENLMRSNFPDSIVWHARVAAEQCTFDNYTNFGRYFPSYSNR